MSEEETTGTDDANTTVSDCAIVWYGSSMNACPYRRPCGKAPCEMGEKCPYDVKDGKKIIYVPYPYYPYPTTTPIYPDYVEPYYTVCLDQVMDGKQCCERKKPKV